MGLAAFVSLGTTFCGHANRKQTYSLKWHNTDDHKNSTKAV